MKKNIAAFVALTFSLFISTQLSFSKEVRYRSFKKKAVQSMGETKAVIQTKFGDITLRVSPDVAPNRDLF